MHTHDCTDALSKHGLAAPQLFNLQCHISRFKFALLAGKTGNLNISQENNIRKDVFGYRKNVFIPQSCVEEELQAD